MEDQNKDLPQQENAKPEDEQDTPGTEGKQKHHRHVSAAELDSIIGSATDAVHNRHAGSELGSTGTNVSYEGPTAPGGGGAVGTGYASGSDATGADISTTNENDLVRENPDDAKDEKSSEGKKAADDDDTIGNP
ncbi:hypothetical protein ACTHGU_21615 [Chitinophagaceae bacterium MMS25-I14]